EADPTALEMAGVVAGDCRGAELRVTGEQAGLDKDLEAVADAQGQAAPVAEPEQGIAEGRAEPDGQDAAGAEVGAERESAGDRQDLEAIEGPGLLDDPANVPGLHLGAGERPRGGRLLVAVDAGGAEDQGTWRGHWVHFPEAR